MKCDEIKKILPDYLEDNINSSDRTKIENHIENCDNCSSQLEQFKILNELITNTKKVESSQSFKNEFFYSLEKNDLNISNSFFQLDSIKNSLKIAASILLFICGTIFGLLIQNHNLHKSKISILENEVNVLKQQVCFEMLNEQTASERIKAINFSIESQNIEIELIDILINTLNTDQNTNVRIAALDALSYFSEEPIIRNSLIKSLVSQDNPQLQVGLIKILVNFNSQEANEAIKVLINQNDLKPEIKLYAQQIIKQNSI